ncbi:MAG: phytoene/squalene synthase family protein [Candidatus Thorarchaeota archaeon]|nr:phytoene/squalene synthase family protein [Candidatus Thorarchaeota archaeon]
MFNDYKTHLTVLPSEIESLPTANPMDLEASYDYCMNLFQLHARSFHFASRYLNNEERRSIAALYAFCRLVDDFADELDLPKDQLERELDVLKNLVTKMSEGKVFAHPLFRAFGDTLVKYKIPVKYLYDLVEGVRMDINLTEICTVDELDKYCYYVASTVGIMMCHIWRRIEPETLERAADLGHAMQITNILRDIEEDYENGRIYIPLETRREFKVDESDFNNKRVSPNFKWMIQHLIARARSIYARAEVGNRDLPPGAAFTVKVAGRVYGEIMTEIEKMDYNVFKKRAVVPKWKKLWIARKLRSEYKREKKEYDLEKLNGSAL